MILRKETEANRVWEKQREVVNIYTDGSYSNNQARWAFCVIENEKVVFEQSGVIRDKETLRGRQIGGECEAVKRALMWCAEFNKAAIIHYDYIGLARWVAEKGAWKCNKPYTAAYRQFVLDHKDYLCKFVKVKAHSGNKWNNYVDKLASRRLE